MTVPKLPNCGRYYAVDNTWQWHYITHAGEWQPCPPVLNVPEGWLERGLAELEAIRNRHDDSELLNDRTLIERLGRAMLAAAPSTSAG